MGKFLDEVGVQTLWNKTKSKISTEVSKVGSRVIANEDTKNIRDLIVFVQKRLDNGFLSNDVHRISSQDILNYDEDVFISIDDNDNYSVAFQTYNDLGQMVSDSGWLVTGASYVPAKTKFRITMRKKGTEEAYESATENNPLYNQLHIYLKSSFQKIDIKNKIALFYGSYGNNGLTWMNDLAKGTCQKMNSDYLFFVEFKISGSNYQCGSKLFKKINNSQKIDDGIGWKGGNIYRICPTAYEMTLSLRNQSSSFFDNKLKYLPFEYEEINFYYLPYAQKTLNFREDALLTIPQNKTAQLSEIDQFSYSGYRVQAMCYHGGFLYLAFPPSNENQNTKLIKYNISSKSVVLTKENHSYQHAGDMTYDSKLNKILISQGIVVAQNDDDAQAGIKYYYVNPDTLEFEKEVFLRQFDGSSICYKKSLDKYYVKTVWGNWTKNFFEIVDKDFNRLSAFDSLEQGWVMQGIDADDSHIYSLSWDQPNRKNYITIYDNNGNYLNRIELDFSAESQGIACASGNELYVTNEEQKLFKVSLT